MTHGSATWPTDEQVERVTAAMKEMQPLPFLSPDVVRAALATLPPPEDERVKGELPASSMGIHVQPPTPPTDERVKGLVEALEEIETMGTRTETIRIGDAYVESGWEDHEVISPEAEIARSALASYRGGA